MRLGPERQGRGHVVVNRGGAVLGALVVLWVVLHRYTDLASRSRKYEGSDPEMAEALRQAEMDAARGRMYF